MDGRALRKWLLPASLVTLATLTFATIAFAADDVLAPVTTSDVSASYAGPANLMLTATDGAGGSGVATIHYTLDGVESIATPAAAPVVVAPAGAPPITPTVTAPPRHMASGTAAGSGGCECHVTIAAAPAITATALQPKNHSDMSCSTCHAVAGAWTDADGTAGIGFVVSSLGTHTLDYWSVDNAGNVESSHSVSFVVKKIATKLTMSSSSSSVALGRRVTFSGRLSPTLPDGTRIVLQKRKSTARSWTRVSTLPLRSGKWTYSYKTTARGTYYFRVTYGGNAGYASSVSNSKAVRVK